MVREMCSRGKTSGDKQSEVSPADGCAILDRSRYSIVDQVSRDTLLRNGFVISLLQNRVVQTGLAERRPCNQPGSARNSPSLPW